MSHCQLLRVVTAVRIALVEKWKSTFRNIKCAGVILMDISKAFDCMHRDL